MAAALALAAAAGLLGAATLGRSIARVNGLPRRAAAHSPALSYPAVMRLAGPMRVRPLQQDDGWYEVMAWGSYRRSGWLSAAVLEPLPGG